MPADCQNTEAALQAGLPPARERREGIFRMDGFIPVWQVAWALPT